MGAQANLTLNQHAALIYLFDKTNVAADIPATFFPSSNVVGQLGSLVSYQFYPATSLYPFYAVIKTSKMTIVLANGTQSLPCAAAQGLGYSTNAVIGGGFAGVSAPVGLYASLLLYAFKASYPLNDLLLVFCGHSYGAAAAFNAARFVKSNGAPVTVEAVGWGGPKWAFSGVVPEGVNGLIETNWALANDVVPRLPPDLAQVPPFYALLPLPISIAMLRYWGPVGLKGLDANGLTNDLSANPWLANATPNGVNQLVRNMDAAFNAIHGSSSYASAIAAFVNRYAPVNSPPVDLPLVLHYPGTPKGPDIAAATGSGLNYLKTFPVILNPSKLTETEPLYRVRRKRRRYYVCRGKIYLGECYTKSDAKKIAKFARQSAAVVGAVTPDELAANDQAIVQLYASKFRTVLV